LTEILLDIANIEGGYGAFRVLHGVSLSVAKGSITALIGGNGAGKTTLMKTIAGAVPAASGQIMFAGTDVTELPVNKRVNRGLVLVPEGRLIFPQLTVEENLRLGAISPRARRDYSKRCEEIYHLFPRLRERRRQHGGTLSGGEQQMLAIGRGLMASPDLLLLDEPSLGLAPIAVESLFETIVNLRDQGVTILVAEQDTLRTLRLADYAYVLENGTVALSGQGLSLIDHPQVRQAYLGM
jgi:branched-chain amino acid transport system ATP-binding protein